MKGHLTSPIEPIKGKGKSGSSSKDNFKRSLAHFTTYLIMKGDAGDIDDWTAEDLVEAKVRIVLFEEFADFLCNFVPDGRTDEYKLKTSETYLTGIQKSDRA